MPSAILKVAESAYTLNGRELTFKIQPASLSKIAIDYRIAAPLLNTFQLAKTSMAGSLKVFVDEVFTIDYVRTGNKITLNFEPKLDSTIDIRYTLPE